MNLVNHTNVTVVPPKIFSKYLKVKRNSAKISLHIRNYGKMFASLLVFLMGLIISLLNWVGSVPLWYYPVLLMTPVAILFFYASLLDYNPLVNRIIFNYAYSEIILGRESISFKHLKGLQIIHKFEEARGRYGPASGDYYGIQIQCEGSEDLDLAFHYFFRWFNKEEDVTTTEDQIAIITQLGEFLLSLIPMTNRSTIPFKRNVLECDPKYSYHRDYSHICF